MKGGLGRGHSTIQHLVITRKLGHPELIFNEHDSKNTHFKPHASAKWEWLRDELTPHEHVVRLSARDAETARFDAESISEAVTRITGVAVRPSAIRELRVCRWDAQSASVSSGAAPPPPPGIHLAGAAVAGTGLAAVIPHAQALAADLLVHPPTSSNPRPIR